MRKISDEETADKDPTQKESGERSLGVLGLTALLFFNVGGGPFGTEGLQQSGGPFFSVIGLLILSLVWSLPVGLMTAELGTAFPRDGGYVLWVEAAFGEFWAFQVGWWSWTAGVIDSAIYPSMFVASLQSSFGIALSQTARQGVMVLFSLGLTSLSLLGIDLVGAAATVFGVAVVVPVVLLAAACLPKAQPAAWLQSVPQPQLVSWINVALWNLQGWDSTSTVGSEVQNPSRTYPRALVFANFAVVLPYVVMLLTAAGVDQDYASYEVGRYYEIAFKYAGPAVGAVFAVSGTVSLMGLFTADLTTFSYQMCGMAEEGLVPAALGARLARFNTPYVALLCNLVAVQLLVMLPFADILSCYNFVYSFQLLIEIAALLQLRAQAPELERPFRIPLSGWALWAGMLPPALLCVFVVATCKLSVALVGSAVMGCGLLLYYLNRTILRGSADARYHAFPSVARSDSES